MSIEEYYRHKYKKYKTKYKNAKIKGGAIYSLSVKQPWFDLMKSGKKTVEGRLNRGIFTKIKKGDSIEWLNKKTRDKITLKIKDMIIYESFKEMLEKEGILRVLPSREIIKILDGNEEKAINEGIKIYMNYFSERDEKLFGVVAIVFEENDQK